MFRLASLDRHASPNHTQAPLGRGVPAHDRECVVRGSAYDMFRGSAGGARQLPPRARAVAVTPTAQRAAWEPLAPPPAGSSTLQRRGLGPLDAPCGRTFLANQVRLGAVCALVGVPDPLGMQRRIWTAALPRWPPRPRSARPPRPPYAGTGSSSGSRGGSGASSGSGSSSGGRSGSSGGKSGGGSGTSVLGSFVEIVSISPRMPCQRAACSLSSRRR
jgi:uncharacterized membrane protein YgcG